MDDDYPIRLFGCGVLLIEAAFFAYEMACCWAGEES
jgi:hypothetical protein